MSELIKQEAFNNLSLKIYYLELSLHTRKAVIVHYLVNKWLQFDHKIVIEVAIKDKHMELLNQLSNVTLKSLKKKSYIL